MALRPESWRTKEEILADLAKAFQSSPQALAQNRKGDLAMDQWQKLFGRFVRPVLLAGGWIVAPFWGWAAFAIINGSKSMGEGLGSIGTTIFHPTQLLEGHGWFVSGAIIAATVVCVGVGVYHALKIDFALWFDLVERKLVIKEGRVEGREEQIFREGGKDPIETYYFDLKTERFEVNLQAYRAIDSGAAYYLYVLPRSRVLVAAEPKMSAANEIPVAS